MEMDKKEIRVFLCTKEELMQAANKYGAKTYRGYLRGFRYGDKIYIIKDAPGRIALAGHELAHALWQEQHTIFPGIMNFSGLFRWFAWHPSDILSFIKNVFRK